MFLGSSRQALGESSPSEQSSAPAVLSTIPAGPAGMAATLKKMCEAARFGVREPRQIVRKQAQALIAGLPDRDSMGEIKALHQYVRDSIRYTRDPVSVERVQSPDETINNMQGDCDDKATLLASLLDSIGHPARFVAIGLNGGPFSHVLVETQIDHYVTLPNGYRDRWIPLETIIPREAGWWPDGVTSAYRRKV